MPPRQHPRQNVYRNHQVVSKPDSVAFNKIVIHNTTLQLFIKLADKSFPKEWGVALFGNIKQNVIYIYATQDLDIYKSTPCTLAYGILEQDDIIPYTYLGILHSHPRGGYDLSEADKMILLNSIQNSTYTLDTDEVILERDHIMGVLAIFKNKSTLQWKCAFYDTEYHEIPLFISQ